jgi:hypothetical protein
LALVIASRLSLSDINERGRGLLSMGSPFFNIMINVRLRALEESAAVALLARAGEAFSGHVRRFACRVSGRQPFLLQALAATLLHVSASDGWWSAESAATAARLYDERVRSHFADQWEALAPLARATVTLLCLLALCDVEGGPGLDCAELDLADAFGAQLQLLHDLDLVVKVGPEWSFERRGLCDWHGETWTLGAQAFAWWVLRGTLAGGPRFHKLDLESPQTALPTKLYLELIGCHTMGRLLAALCASPALAHPEIGHWARTLYETLAEARPR